MSEIWHCRWFWGQGVLMFLIMSQISMVWPLRFWGGAGVRVFSASSSCRKFDTADGFTFEGFGVGVGLGCTNVSHHVANFDGLIFYGFWVGQGCGNVSHHVTNLTMPLVVPFSILESGGCQCCIRFSSSCKPDTADGFPFLGFRGGMCGITSFGSWHRNYMLGCEILSCTAHRHHARRSDLF